MSKWLLVVIVGIAFLLRTVGLVNHPAGFTPDEASFGYDAYSILKTARDQWGSVLPLNFRSFGDFKMPLYSYLDIPFVAVLGLNEFAVRLPNAILGTLAVWVTYLLVWKVFEKKTQALLAALLLAVSPWHVPLSRGAFEANLTTFFLPLGILAFFQGFKNQKLMILSGVILGLNLFTYHSARLVTPLIFVALFWLNKNKLKKGHFISAVVFGTFCLFAAITMFTGAAARAITSGIFSPTDSWGAVSDARYQAILVGLPDDFARIFNNKFTYLFSNLTRNYLSYFSPQFLFTQGPYEGTYGMLPGRGVIYLIEVVFLLGFIWGIVQKKFANSNWLIFWFLVAPIPAALAKGPGHAANRVAIMMPAIQIALALGAFYIYKKLSKQIRSKIVFVLFFPYFVSVLFFAEDYFFQQPATQAKAMIYGTKQIMDYLTSVEDQYQEIVFSKAISEPHIFVAFYKKIAPETIQKESPTWILYEKEGLGWVDQLGTYRLGKYTFKHLNWQTDSSRPGVLLIGEPNEFPQNVVKKIIYYPNRKDAFWVVDPKDQFFAFNK